jgi:hypothetical protein
VGEAEMGVGVLNGVFEGEAEMGVLDGELVGV